MAYSNTIVEYKFDEQNLILVMENNFEKKIAFKYMKKAVVLNWMDVCCEACGMQSQVVQRLAQRLKEIEDWQKSLSA